MKRFFDTHPFWARLFFAFLLVFCASFAHSQTFVRWDLGAPGGTGAATTSGAGLPFYVAIPGVQLNWCNYPANANPCTNYATTYTSISGSVPCATNAQIVLQGSSTCVSSGDNFGDVGVYTATNTTCGVTCYAYTLTYNGQSFGPFIVTLGGGSGGTPCLIASTIQYNNSGVFGCEALLAYDPSTHTLSAKNLNLTGLLNVGTPNAVCGTASQCIAFSLSTGAVTPLAGQASLRFLAGGMFCSVNGGAELTCGSATPIYLNAGTPTSQGNECAGVVLNSTSPGGVVVAAPALRTIGPGGAAHDIACVVTADSGSAGNIGQIVFPFGYAFSGNSDAPSTNPGQLHLLAPGTGPAMILTNNSGTNRTNSINFRACNNLGFNCGTDMQLIEDNTQGNYEEFLFVLAGGNNPLYFGNRLNSRHPGIYMGSNDASVGAYFGLDQVAGKLDHIVRLSTNCDIWCTVTLTGGTGTIGPFNRNFTATNAPLCFLTWQSGTLTGFSKCAPIGSSGAWTGFTVTSSVGTDNATFSYLILGNNN